MYSTIRIVGIPPILRCGPRADQQHVTRLEHVLALRGTGTARRPESWKWTSSWVVAPVVNPLVVGAEGRLDHDVFVDHQLEVFPSRDALVRRIRGCTGSKIDTAFVSSRSRPPGLPLQDDRRRHGEDAESKR